MKLAFMPGKLFLEQLSDGSYSLTMEDEELLNTKNERHAIKMYNKIRKEMEEKYPPSVMSVEEKRAKFFSWVYGQFKDIPRESKKAGRKYQPGSTNTFG